MKNQDLELNQTGKFSENPNFVSPIEQVGQVEQVQQAQQVQHDEQIKRIFEKKLSCFFLLHSEIKDFSSSETNVLFLSEILQLT